MEKPVRQSRGEQLDVALIEASRRLTPEERLNAFLTHSELMMELYLAGQALRTQQKLDKLRGS